MAISAATSPPKLTTLVLLTAFSTLSLNMFVPSLANIAAGLRADYALVNLSISGFLAVTAVLQVVLGPLSDRYGRRLVLLVALTVFVVASVGCLLAQDVWTFLAFRLLQGAVIAGSALSPAIVRDTAPAQRAASLIGYIAMAMAAAPMLAPVLGGGLDELFGWRANFAAFAIGGGLLLVLCWVDLGETNAAPAATFAQQLRVYPELLRSPRFWGYALCTSLSAGSFFAFLSGAPLVAHAVLDLSPATLGICLGSITGGFAFGSFLSGRIAARHELTTMMLAGRVVACLGLSVGLVLLLAGVVNVFTIFGATLFVGIGNGLTAPSGKVGAMSVRPRLAGSAAGLSGALTVAIGAVLTSLTGVVLPVENPAPMLIVVMLASAFGALLAALAVRWLEARRS